MRNLNAILNQVDVERLYQHVLKLEGIKNPLVAPEKLDEAADYIYAELAANGVPVRAQEFQIEALDGTFRNIEGWIGDPDQPAAVIINHYDTVYNSPGANDNAAGVAVMLEAARVLADETDGPTVRFVSATMEEGSTIIEAKTHQKGRELGLFDEQHRYKTWRVARIMKKHTELVSAAHGAGKGRAEAVADATDQLADQMPENVREYLTEIQEIYGQYAEATMVGQIGKVGSSAWVDEAVQLGKKIAFAICLDEIGTTSKQEGSQRLPSNLTYDMLRTYKVDRERQIGDWAIMIADAASGDVAAAFCAHCERDAIDLPYGYLQLPDYEGIVQHYPQAFGSDHAPFWREGFPAIMVFDTSGWRSPYCHSMADTIDKLDFEQITKVCKATIATAVDPSLRVQQTQEE